MMFSEFNRAATRSCNGIRPGETLGFDIQAAGKLQKVISYTNWSYKPAHS